MSTVTVPETCVGEWFWDNVIQAQRLGLDITRPSGKGVLDPYLRSLSPYGRGLVDRFYKKDKLNRCPTFAGKISFLQEPGFKLRAVANPNRVVQWYLDPLKQHIADIVRENFKKGLDFTFDQSQGIAKVQGWLTSNQKVYSVDLSDATNNYPLGLQVSHLRLNEDYSNAFHPLLRDFVSISRAPWRVWDPTIKKERSIQWKCGQPLGLGPSFFLFSLSHVTLLEQCRRDTKSGDFAVLGDDVCIVGDTLHQRYREILAYHQIPVAEAKCLTSCHVAEFAGKIITYDHIYPQPKWREVSDRSFLDIVKNIGPSGRALLRKRQQRIFDLIAPIPEWMGGLGMNPKGLSLIYRYRLALYVERLLEKEDDRQSDLLRQELSRRRIAFSVQTGASSIELDSSMDEDGYGVPARDPQSDLSYLLNTENVIVPPQSDPRGETTLVVLERKLKTLLAKGVEQFQEGVETPVPPQVPIDLRSSIA